MTTTITINITTSDPRIAARVTAALDGNYAPRAEPTSPAPTPLLEPVAPTPPAPQPEPPAPPAPQASAPAPTPPAPQPQAPTPPQAASAERDADGIPWDARVHTSNRATRQDGVWKRKPGLEDAYYNEVLAELKAGAPAPKPPASQGMNDYMPNNAYPSVFDGRAPITPPPPPVPAEVLAKSDAPVPPAPPAPTGGMTFSQFIQAVTAKQIPRPQVEQALQAVGLDKLPQLMQQPDLVPAVAQALGL